MFRKKLLGMVFQISGEKICISEKELKLGLSAEQLEKNLKNVDNFGGIISINDLDRIIINSYPLSLIVYYKMHWIALFIDENNLEVFDSTAEVMNMAPKSLINFLCNNSQKKIKFSSKMQGNQTKLCGLYTLYFILMKSKKYSWKKIIRRLKAKKNVDNFIRSVFNCEI